MWKAAFTGRSEKGEENGYRKPAKDEPRRKKSSHSHRAESVISTSSRRDDDRDRERRKSHRGSSVYENGASRYETASSYTSSGPSQYGTAPTSRVGAPRPLTESALRMLPDDEEEEWEDDDKDARSERLSKKRSSGDEKRRKSTRSEKDRSRSRSRDRKEKRKESKTSEKPRDKERDRSRRDTELVTESSRAIPEMGSFAQFPGQYAGGYMGPSDPAMMSGALPSSAPQQQFPGQDPYARPSMPPSKPSRGDSYGHAAEYYLDEGQSVQHQPGFRTSTPNMLVNPDLHLVAASAEANPAQDTGNGAAADFYNGKVSPVPNSQFPSTAPTTPAKPSRIGKTSASAPSSSSKPRPSRTSSAGAAAIALAAGAGVASLHNSSHRYSQSQQVTTSSSAYQQGSSYTSKPAKPNRHSSDGSAYYQATSSNSTYPPTLPSTNGHGPYIPTNVGTPGRQSTNNNTNTPLYAAAAAGAAGLAAHEYSQHHQHSNHETSNYGMTSTGGFGGGQGPPRSPRAGPGGSYYGPPQGHGGGMAQMPFHEHKGPMTRLKDGLLNIISTPEDVAKMEMYTEYIGVCKHCFDPRTSAWDAPRVHHYHKRRDSFESLRRRRSGDRLGRKGSDDSLRRQGSTRVDKDNRYYASESSRRKRDSGGVGVLGAGLATVGGLAAANALHNDRKDFDDTYSVKSGHRESSAVRRRSRSSSHERRRRSQYGVVRPDRDEFVTVRRKDGTIERRRVSKKSRSSSRERKSSGILGAAAAGAALGAAGMAASSRHRSRSRSHSPTILSASDTRPRRSGRHSPSQSSYYDISRRDRPQESQGIFGGFFSPPQEKHKRRHSREHQKKRKGFFTFSNSSSSSSNSDIAFGDGFASRTSLPLSRKSSAASRTGRRQSGRASRKRSDDHLAATVAGIGATAAALAAAQRGGRITKRTSRPELGKRRDVRHSHADSSDEEWEDELPSDIDDASSVEGGLAYGEVGRHITGRQSMESIASQSSAGGLGAWGWRWGGKDKKRQSRRSSSPPSAYPQNHPSSFAAPGLAGIAAGPGSPAIYDASRPIRADKPVYLDDTGRRLPSVDSTSITSGPQGPLQFVDPAPISEAGTPSRFPSMPGAFDEGIPVSRPGPGPIQAPQPISPAQPTFTQSPPDMDSTSYQRPSQPRHANSGPSRGSFAQDAALIGGAALATAGAIAGMSSISGRSGRDKDPSSRVSFGLTNEQQEKEDRERRREQKAADEERRRADRTRALKEEADRAAKESRQEEVRRQREEENRKAAEARLQQERLAQREAEERAERERQQDQARRERERLENEAKDRQEAAIDAAAEVERHRKAREEAQKRAESIERERREREEAYAREQARYAAEAQRSHGSQDVIQYDQYDPYAQHWPSQSPDQERRQWPSARRQSNQYGNQSPEGQRKQSSSWAPVAAGAAAAATMGAVMAGHQREQKRDRKSRENGYYDEAHQDHSEQSYGSVWEADQKNVSHQSPDSRAELERRASEKYGRSKAGVEVHDEYAAAEIKPKNEHEGEPLMDDDIYDPDFFKKKHSPAENARYAEFARKAADKVVNDREHAYDDDKKTTYADFFAPKELLAKEPEGKTRAVSPDGDMDMQVYHERDAESRSHFSHGSDYGYGRSKDAPHGVPRLNVIAPTPPPGSTESSPRRSKEQKNSPLSQEQVQELADELNKSTVAQSRSEKSERSRSISWGDDRTHYYNVDTPDSHQDRDSWISSPDVRGEHATAAAAGIAGAAAAGAALHEIVVEETDGAERHYTEEEWLRQEESDSRAGAQDDDLDVEDITPSPEPEPQGFYRQPFFDSVSDMDTAVFGLDSPGTEGAPPIRGFVEGETDEPTPTEEKQPHIPGGFDDETDDIYRPSPKNDDEINPAEIEREQAAAAVADAAEEVDAWQPPLSKKDKKKREKEAKRAGSVAESVTVSEPSTYFTAQPEPVEEPAWEPPLSKKEQKKRDREAKRLSDIMDSDSPTPASAAEAPRDADEPAWAPPLSAKEKKKRDKAAKQAVSVAESDQSMSVDEPGKLVSPDTQTPAEPEEGYFLSKKDKKKRDKARKQSGDLASSIEELPSEARPIESRSQREPLADDQGSTRSNNEQKDLDKDHLGDAALVAGGVATAAAVLDSSEDVASGSSKKKKKGKKAKLGEPSYDDPRDLPSDLPAAPEPPISEPHGMPGGWDSDPRVFSENLEDQNTVDPFQFRVPEEDSKTVEQETPTEEDWASWGSSSKKSKKKSKRNSAAFNLPEVSSPLRTEIPFDDYVAPKHVEDEQTPYSNGRADERSSSRSQDGASIRREKPTEDKSRPEIDYFNESRRRSDSPKQISPDDSRSVISAPEDRTSRREAARRNSDYADEPAYAYETASVAATEPIGDYDRSRNSKRRSKHADDGDDLRSVTSSRSRSRRDKEESPSDKKKEKKGGLFGLFSRKSTDDVTSYKDESSLSRTSTRESKREAEDDESRHRRKHRSRSEYGDEDDTRSVKSGSSKSRRHRSEKGSDDESKERRRRSTRDDYDDRASPARSEPGHRHHRRRGTEDDGNSLSRRESRDSHGLASESGHRHHHRRRTDEDAYGAASRDQSFLGMRVEDLPPLPVSRPATPESAAAQQREGSSAEAESGAGLVTGAAIAAGLGAVVGAAVAGNDKHKPGEHVVEQRHPDHVPETPRSSLDAPSRPVSMGRPPSSSAVPLHFPGRAPQTPTNPKDRAHSFSSPAVRSPATTSSPASVRSRQGRPQSTEIRPLYLVERNRQTPVPEVEDALPSLPSSKPSSRASSVHDSDEGFQSALEDFDSPQRSRAGTLSLDMDAADAYKDELGSGEVTPKASDFHSLPGSAEKGPKQEPQFYTWEDFAQDERLHEQEAQPEEGESARATTESTQQNEMPRDRSQSPAKSTSSFKSAAAAAMLGTAAVYAHHKSRERSDEPVADAGKDDSVTVVKHDYPLPAPVERVDDVEIVLEQAPTLTRKSSSKKKKGNKSKNSALQEDAVEASASHIPAEVKNEPISEIVASAPAHIDRGPVGVQSDEASDKDDSTSDRPEEDTSMDAKADAKDSETLDHNDTFLPSSAAHSRPGTTYSQDFFASKEVEHNGTTSGSGSGVPTPFMAVPTPADNIERFVHDEEKMENGTAGPLERQDIDADRFLREESKMEDGSETSAQVPENPEAFEQEEPSSLSYKVPTAKAELAPVVIEERNVGAAEPPVSEVRPVAQLTRKQTKKGKKKGKSAMLWEDEPAGTIIHQPLQLDTGINAESSARDISPVDEPLTAIEQTMEEDLPRSVSATPVFGTADFNTIALGTGSSWQDAQAQAFQDSMLAKPEAGAADLTQDTSPAGEIEPPGEYQVSQPKTSNKKSKKDKKKNALAEPTENAETPPEQSATREPEADGSDRGAVIAAGLGAAAAAIGIGESLDKRSKNKAKKDKKRQTTSWAEDEAESPTLPQPDHSTTAELERELGEAQDISSVDPLGTEEHTASMDEPEPVNAHRLDLGPIGAQSVDASAEDVSSEMPATDGDLSSKDDAPPAAQEDFYPIVTKKKGKKHKKQFPDAATPEPEIQALEDSPSRRMSFNDNTFVDATESQAHEDSPSVPAYAETSEARLDDTSPGASAEQAIEQDQPVEETFAPVSRKQSKKDKKKKKSAQWSEPEPESSATVESSRRESVDDAAFVDASEDQAPDANVANSKNILEADLPTELPSAEAQDTIVPAEIVQPEQSTAQEEPEHSALNSNRKSKKDKKKQSFDWTTLDDTAESAPAPDESVPHDVPGTASAVNEQSEHREKDKLALPGAQDSIITAEPVFHETTILPPIDRKDFDLGSVGPTDTSAVDVPAVPPIHSQPMIQEASVADEAIDPIDELAPVSTTKKGKKKKKQQSLNWENLDNESGQAVSFAERQAADVATPIEDSALPSEAFTEAAANERSETSRDTHESAQNSPEVVEPSTDDFAPVTSSKKSKKDKKRGKKNAFDGIEPEAESETTTAVTEPRDEQEPGPTETPEDVPESIDSLPQDNLEETMAQDVVPAEEAQDESLRAMTTKKTKKDKKKKKSGAFDWDAPESEATTPLIDSRDDTTEADTSIEAGQQVVDTAAESEPTTQLEEVSVPIDITFEAPKDDFEPVSTAKKSKKDKKKKKSTTFGWDMPEPEATTLPTESRADHPEVGASADATVAEQTEQVPQTADMTLEEFTDDFAPAGTSKKSKKDKKKKRSTISWDEPGSEATTPMPESRDELLQPEVTQETKFAESQTAIEVASPIEAGSKEVETVPPDSEHMMGPAAPPMESMEDKERNESVLKSGEAEYDSVVPAPKSRDELSAPEASTVLEQEPEISTSQSAAEVAAPMGAFSGEVEKVIPESEGNSASATSAKKTKKDKKKKKYAMNWDEPEPESTGTWSKSRDEPSESAPITELKGQELSETILAPAAVADDLARAADTTHDEQADLSRSADAGSDEYIPATSSKQSKKDKKKKKQALSWDEPEANSDATPQAALHDEQTAEYAPDASESFSVTDPSQTAVLQQDDIAPVQTETKPEDDEFAAVSTKKSKRDKKKKQSLSWETPDAESHSMPQAETDNGMTVVGTNRDLSTTEQALEATGSAKKETVPDPTEASAVADENASLSAKKSKKDKKKKKQASSWDEPSAETELVPQSEVIDETAAGETDRDSPTAERAPESANAAGGDTIAAETEATPNVDEAESFSTKKSKKDKKKKRQAFSWDEPESEPVQDTVVTQHDAEHPAEQTEKNLASSQDNLENLAAASDTAALQRDTGPAAEQTDAELPQGPADDLGISTDKLGIVPAALNTPASAFEPTHEAVTEPRVQAPVEDEFKPTLSRKQSKQDKKKKLQQKLDDLVPDEDASPAGDDEQIQAEGPARNANDELLLKDAANEVVLQDPNEKEPELLNAESSAAVDDVQSSERLVEAPIDEEFKPTLSRKQSKKDKKKKLQQSLEELEPEQTEQNTTISGADDMTSESKVSEPSIGVLPVDAAEDSVTDEAIQIEASREDIPETKASSPKLNSEDASDIQTTLQERPEDDWGFATTSKKKKGKKGKKAETLAQSAHSQQPPVVDDADEDHVGGSEQPVTQSWDDMVIAEQNASQSAQDAFEAMPTEKPTPQDDFSWLSSSKKKGKKGKNARASLLETPPTAEEVPSLSRQQTDEVAAPSEIAPETAMPLGDESQAQTPSAEYVDEFSWAPSSKKKKGKKSKKSQSADLETFNETASGQLEASSPQPSEPSKLEAELAANMGEEPSRDGFSSLAKDQTAFEPPDAEPAQDDAGGFSTTSKKQAKKGKKGMLSGTTTPIEELQEGLEEHDQVNSEQEPTSTSRELPVSESVPEGDVQSNNVDSVADVDDRLAAGTAQSEQEQQEDFSWTSSSKKKAKKSKKSKQPELQAPVAEVMKQAEDAESIDPNHDAPQADPNEPRVDEIPRAQDTPVIPEPAVEDADDLWAASTSKKKKGKKGKKTPFGTATPVPEPVEPISETPLGMQEDSDVLGETGEAQSVVPEPAQADDVDKQQSSEIQHEVGFVSDQPVITPVLCDQEAAELPGQETVEPSVILEPSASIFADHTPAAEPGVVETEDTWAVPSSTKKKSQKGKKRGSAISTPAEPETSVPSIERESAPTDTTPAFEQSLQDEDISRLVQDEATDNLGEQQDDAHMIHDTAVTHEGQDAEPASATFDDVWAEEDIATSEDHGAVQDLFEENAEDARSSWTPGSKKSKKKKGKKGSVSAGAAANYEPETFGGNQAIVSEPVNKADTPLPQAINATEEPAIAKEKPSDVSSQPGPIAEQAASSQVNELKSQDNINEAVEDDANADTAIDVTLWTPQTGKRKGKKDKKGKSGGEDETSAIVPSNENLEDVILPAAEDRAKGLLKPVDEPEQRPGEIDQAAANVEDNIVDDDWSVPQSGKKKGKKGKKAKQALTWQDEAPVDAPRAQEVRPASAVQGTAPENEASKEIPPDSPEDADVNVIVPATIDADQVDTPDHAAADENTFEHGQPPEEGSDNFSTIKKSKKDKKKARDRKASSTTPWDEPLDSSAATAQTESEQVVDHGHSASFAATSVATAALAGVVAHEIFDKNSEDDSSTSFSTKRSKKDKKRAKKSGTATPSTPLDDLPVPTDVDIKDFAPHVEQDSRGPVVDPSYYHEYGGINDDQEPTESRDLPPESPTREQDTAHVVDESAQGDAAKHSADEDARDTTASPAQDIEFTATVAAGLADSGFDPDLVINDPVFQRRASPPGLVAEADPGEVFSTTTRRKKGNMDKKSPEVSDSPVAAPLIPAEEAPSNSLARDDFDDAITQSLQGTGFDPALLEKASASSKEPSSKEGIEDPEEFSFTTTKRNKGKKGRKSHAQAADIEPAHATVDSLATNAFETQGDHAKDTSHGLTRDLQDSQLETSAAGPINVSEQQEPSTTNVDLANASSSRDDQHQINILSVGHDEMDMEEMDRQYREYKKNKRKQKKLKAASRAAGLSDNPESATEQSTMVSESEGLSTTTTRENILSPQTTLDATTRQLAGEIQAATDMDLQSKPDAKSAASPLPTQSIFGERVKRRIPPKPKPEDLAQDRRSSLDAPTEPRPEFGTAGMAAVVAAAARERQARKESSKTSSESAKQEPSRPFDKLQDSSHAMPESPILGNKVHQPIRDSGYQEATRSPKRGSGAGREVPEIVHTKSSRDSLRDRRSLEPLQIPPSPENTWDIKNPKKRGDDSERKHDKTRLISEESARTPSAETPLKPTSKDRASYLFQSPPGNFADISEGASPSTDPLTPQPTDSQGYFKTTSPRPSESYPQSEAPRSLESARSGATFSLDREVTPDSGRERTVISPSHGPLSPRLALDPIPEDRPTSKRGHSNTDIGGPDHIKALKRTESPQGNNSQERALSTSVRPSITIPLAVPRSVSNPLSTDQLINRLSWPSVDEEHDTVNIDRHLGHRHSRPALPDPRSPSVLSNRSNASGQHFKSPQELRSYSRTSNRSSTPSLRRTSLSGDLRAASRRGDGSTTGSAVGARDSPKTIPFEAPPTPPPNDDELMSGSASRAVDMNDDVFQGYGDAQQSQASPTRPPSVRKRQSMHITDLESQLGQLAAENRALREAREYADQTNDAARDVNGQALREALEARDQQLQEKDHEISAIKAMLQPLQEEVARLVEINGGLTEANRNLVDDTNGRYATLQAEHAHAHEQWQSASRDLEGMRHEHGRITSGMKDIVEAEIATALADKNAEILRLREQLDIAAEQIRALQVQIQSSKSSDFLVQRDEDYFDGSCQKLCQHVQQWVLRFSKMSDNRICRLSTDLNDDKIEARLDNAVLDGSDVDKLLGDRVRRRDVFMSVVMTMVWEYVFTRYLFGMDREQRQKLKALEKLLAEVGPTRAVSHWRATTLTLLAKRPSFEKQCTLDTEAVCHEIFGVLCSLLPPPSSSQQQLLTSLQKVIRIAVDLSIEMRTQRAEYIMLPPLQPEYDTNGDLVRKVHFNASLMNERSGFFSSNEELAAEHAVVKIVLFPLVVKKGDDYGEGEEEIVVCPAQVLVQNDGGRGKKVVRVMSGAMEIDDPIRSRQSRHSLVSETPGSVGF